MPRDRGEAAGCGLASGRGLELAASGWLGRGGGGSSDGSFTVGSVAESEGEPEDPGAAPGSGARDEQARVIEVETVNTNARERAMSEFYAMSRSMRW